MINPPEPTEQPQLSRWRVGHHVPINVYEGDRPVCQCHTATDALQIVKALNGRASLEFSLSAVISCAGTGIERGDRTLEDWLAQVLQVLVMGRDNAETERDRVRALVGELIISNELLTEADKKRGLEIAKELGLLDAARSKGKP